MKKYLIFIFILIFVFLNSCNNDFTFDEEISSTNVSNTEIVLGKKRENPFSLYKKRIANNNVTPNYYYYKIRTKDFENIELIKQQLGELSVVPLDYEIIEPGCDFPLNNGDGIFSPWFYSITTVETYNVVKDFGEIEIIEEMYISDDDLLKFTETEDNISRGIFNKNIKARPTGYIYFYDEVKQSYIPLKGVKVTVSQWCYSKSVYTNSSGYYDLGENITSFWQTTANIKITFETNTDSIYPEWSLVEAKYNYGDRKIENLNRTDIYLTKGSKENAYGILLNATTQYRDYAKSDGVTTPENLKFWTSTNINGGVTLMRDVVVADSAAICASIGAGLIPGAGKSLGALKGAALGAYFPDIIISTNSGAITQTESITECVFHEMSHASHYTGIGTGKITYWNQNYINMLGGWISVLSNGSSPFDNCYNDGKNAQVSFIESWGYFYGFYLTYRYFNDYRTKISYDYYLSGKSSFCSFFYYSSYYKILQYISISQIFTPYKYYSVKSINNWYSKQIELNGKFDSLKEIKQVFMNRGISL